MTYCNPLLPDLDIGDPFVLRHDGVFFLYGTTDPDRGFRVFRSGNLVDWEAAGCALDATDISRGKWGAPPFWAPEVRAFEGRFIMTYSARDEASGRLLTAIAESDSPIGPFRNTAAPWFDFGYSAIDTHLFVDTDGAIYAYFSRNGETEAYSYGMIYGFLVEPDLSGPAERSSESGECAMLLMQADQPWERIAYESNRCNEGPFVFRRGDTYYMTYSANHTFRPGYGIGYATAQHPLGPWTKSKRNPIASSDPDVGYAGAGHNSIVTLADGRMFIVYHTNASPGDPGNERRQLNIDELVVESSGALRIVGPTRSTQQLVVTSRS